jgi:hypothetical protein
LPGPANKPRLSKTDGRKGSPIIDRPQGFDPLEVVPRPAPPKKGGSPGGLFSLDGVGSIPAESSQHRSEVTQGLQAYARLLRLKEPGGFDDGKAPISCGARAFQAGKTRIDNAWLVDSSRMRLVIAGDMDAAGGSNSVSIRAYQARPSKPAELQMLGHGVQLSTLGPVIHDIELLHPLMPLLLELSDASETTLAVACLPFPSLLPGGLHGAELKALQTEPNPMDDFWVLSERLLQQAVDCHGRGERSVAVSAASGSNEQAALTPEVREWLSVVFEVTSNTDAPEIQALRLVLPLDSVPTISVLASRHLGVDGSTATVGSYLIAERDGYQPRWSITLPAERGLGSALPVLTSGSTTADLAPSAETAPVPLAIAIRSPTTPRATVFASESRATNAGTLSVLVDATHASRAEPLVRSIRAAATGDIQWLVRADAATDELRPMLDRACNGQGWAAVSPGADLRQIADSAQHEILLTISDRIDPDDARALGALLDILRRHESAASASCALLAEKIIKKQVVLQPASGGLFPTGVSFLNGPRLSFGEPDVLQALPDLTYPVLANTMLLTTWRRSALAELPKVPMPGAPGAQDVRVGLDLLRQGYRNWCTTKVTARLSGPYVPRDQIDPVGAGYLPPAGWEDILNRVTLVRELI